jgi:hypothetical protein
MHAALEYAIQYPDRFKEWHATSQTVVLLTVPNVDWLHLTARKIEFSVPVARFREPDMGNQLTAIACVYSGKRLAKLHLLKGGE